MDAMMQKKIEQLGIENIERHIFLWLRSD